MIHNGTINIMMHHQKKFQSEKLKNVKNGNTHAQDCFGECVRVSLVPTWSRVRKISEPGWAARPPRPYSDDDEKSTRL